MLGDAVTAGFLFDVPVRFDTDYLEVDLSAFAAGAIPKIPLVEIRVVRAAMRDPISDPAALQARELRNPVRRPTDVTCAAAGSSPAATA